MNNMYKTTYMFIQAVIIGVLTALAAIAFRSLITFFQSGFNYTGHTVLSFMGRYYVIVIPAIGGLAVGLLTKYFANEARGAGVPEVINAVANLGGRIRKRVVIVKALACSIYIGSGGSVGREGPIIHIGSAIGSSVGQSLKLTRHQVKNLVACGAAAGIAATFNAPIAGVLFAMEIVLRDISRFSFGLIVISSVVASSIARAYYGNAPAFKITPYTLNHYSELILYLALGIVCAGTALLFVRTVSSLEKYFNISRIPDIAKPVLGGLLIGVIGLYFPQIFGVGYGSIEQALGGMMSLKILFLLVFLKMAATSISIASGGSGGYFAPSLFIGAMTGGTLGRVFEMMFPSLHINPGSYSLVGMAALFAAAAQAPISTIIILFELTDDYRIILPLMLSCVVSNSVYNHFNRDSIYTEKLTAQGIYIPPSGQISLFDSIAVRDAMIEQVDTVLDTEMVGDIIKKIEQTHHKHLPVLNKKSELIGVISLKDIKDTPAKTLLKDIINPEFKHCLPDQSLNSALGRMDINNIGWLPVVDETNPKKMLGIITRKSLLEAYNNMKNGSLDKEV
ncbi:MAG: chloride channel protein [Candidatus Margulisiibacteriota bacterium]